jgi:hypothetical protein
MFQLFAGAAKIRKLSLNFYGDAEGRPKGRQTATAFWNSCHCTVTLDLRFRYSSCSAVALNCVSTTSTNLLHQRPDVSTTIYSRTCVSQITHAHLSLPTTPLISSGHRHQYQNIPCLWLRAEAQESSTQNPVLTPQKLIWPWRRFSP